MSNTTEIPRLSPSIAKVLLLCPAKAYLQHRLLGGQQSESTDAQVAGSILERVITLHGLNDIEVIDAPDYKTKDARALRDDAIAAGRFPIIASKYEWYQTTGGILREKIAARLPLFDDALDQVRFEWESNGVLCSGVMDKFHKDGRATIYDLKSCTSANKSDIERSIVKYGYDVQQAAYVDAVNTIHPSMVGRVDMRFIFYEVKPPYCVTVARLDGSLKMLGESKWCKAKSIWRECLESGVWPEYLFDPDDLYTDGTLNVSAKPWDLTAMDGSDYEQTIPF